MNLELSFAVFWLIWWIVLFSVLPVGVTSYAEAGLPTPGGGDPGSPVDPKLKRKFITTTWVSVLVFAPFWIAVHFHWISMDLIRGLR